MIYSKTIYAVLICTLAAAATPALAQSWDPTSSDAMNNTAMGTGALANPDLDSDGGCHNVASGMDALNVDTSGSYNVAMGFDSLVANLTGNNNTAVGAETMEINDKGSNNIAVGYQALWGNYAGNNNTA